MEAQNNYQRIAQAIEYIQQNYRTQPSLDEVAAYVHVSPFHFQRIFTEWAGVSPKKFLQYISLSHAKHLLRQQEASLFDATEALGLSGTSRLHDLFISIEGMTPGEYKNGGASLPIYYTFAESPFGKLLVASTYKGICYMAFYDNSTEALAALQAHFPNAHLVAETTLFHQQALLFFQEDWQALPKLKLHLKGSDFQLKIWEALLKIPMGELTTYGTIAQQIQHPKAARAVGTAIGSNPVAYLIPCHRVIQTSGALGGYMWGTTRKTAIIGWESAKVFTPQQEA